MTSSDTPTGTPVLSGLSTGQLLAQAGEVEALARQVEVALLEVALEWAIAHPVVDPASTSVLETPDEPGGVGTPAVAAFATDTLAAGMRIAPITATHLVADALDLSFRLPMLWELTRALRVPAARARRVASATRHLGVEGAAWVDRQVAGISGRVSTAQLDRIVAHATAQFDPDALKTREDKARDTWGVDLDHPAPGEFACTSTLTARGDTLDLTRFHDLVCDEADVLARLGDTDTLGQRKAKALGVIAAQQAALDLVGLIPDQQPDGQAEPGDIAAVRAKALARGSGKVKLHLHASLTDLLSTFSWTTDRGDLVGTVDTLGSITLDKIKDWVGHSRVTITPVLHVASDDTWTVDRHDPPPRMAEMVRLRDESCVFPRCGRHAAGCDLDHVTPYESEPPVEQGRSDALRRRASAVSKGPRRRNQGTTTPANLAPLCRRHHRAKTSGAWSYECLAPGTYLWTGPAGLTTLVTPDTIHDL